MGYYSVALPGRVTYPHGRQLRYFSLTSLTTLLQDTGGRLRQYAQSLFGHSPSVLQCTTEIL
uniref:Uncharacterized protein n=1 Tax=Candidatus Kentrum sp. DK TaxID=2126562 RepID=A0A450S0P3_9GAMM|nr:MAG: hypothetical protein BECKDK2373C_GA0170839_101060 [Candidatus Kentron sp. DK]